MKIAFNVLCETGFSVIKNAAHGKHEREIKKAPNSVHRDQRINIVTLE